MLTPRDWFHNERHTQAKSREIEKGIICKWKQKKQESQVAILITDKIDFNIKAIKRDKEIHYIMIKVSIWQDCTCMHPHKST